MAGMGEHFPAFFAGPAATIWVNKEKINPCSLEQWGSFMTAGFPFLIGVSADPCWGAVLEAAGFGTLA